MRYSLTISPDAENDVREIFNYLAYSVDGVGNPLVAKKFYSDLRDAFDKIEFFPEGFSLCEDAGLAELCVRKIKLRHYDYNIFYHVVDEFVVVDMVCHNLRDYKRIMEERL